MEQKVGIRDCIMRSSHRTHLPWNEGNTRLQTKQLATCQGGAMDNESH